MTARKAYATQSPETDKLRAGDMVMVNETIDLLEKESCDTGEVRTWGAVLVSGAGIPKRMLAQ